MRTKAIAATLLLACATLDPATAQRTGRCIVSDPTGTALNVRATLHLTDNNTVTGQAAGGPGAQNVSQFTAANTEFLSRADEAALDCGDIGFTFAAWVYLDSLGTNTILGKLNAASLPNTTTRCSTE